MRIEVDQRDETETRPFVIETPSNHERLCILDCLVPMCQRCGDRRILDDLNRPSCRRDDARLSARIESPCEHQQLIHESTSGVIRHSEIVAEPAGTKPQGTL